MKRNCRDEKIYSNLFANLPAILLDSWLPFGNS